MQRFTVAARLYIWSVIGMGLVALGYAWWDYHSRSGTDAGSRYASPLVLLLGCLSVAVASRFKVTLFRSRSSSDQPGDNNKVTMSLGYVPTFLLLFSFGPLAGVLAGVSNTVALSRRTPLYRRLFNAAALLLSAFFAGLTAHPFGLAPGGWDPLALARTGRADHLFLPLVGIALAATVYYLVNTGLVATAIGLTSEQKPFQVWREYFLRTAPGYFAGASCAAVIMALLPHLSNGGTNFLAWTAILLVSVPIPTIIFFVYKYHAQLDEANQARIEALRQSAEELERKNAELQRGRDELQQLYTSTVKSLALAIDAKDRYTQEHIERVKGFAVAIAAQMGLVGDELKAVETGAFLHDIGKLAVPEHILTKPGRLTDEEFAKVKAHPDMGARILEPVHFPFPVMPIVRHHHERWDGKGYPDGLKGEDIPLGARILAVADVYDALTSDRSYRPGWTHERAISHLREHSGSHFDPQVVDAFLAVLECNQHMCVRKTPVALVGADGGLQETVAAGINRASFEYFALYEISQVATVTLNLSEMLSLVGTRVRNIFNASTCVLLLKEADEGGERLRVRSAHGENEMLFEQVVLPIGCGDTGMVAATGRGALGTVRASDLGFSGEDGVDDGGQEPFRSVVIAPLMADGSVIGTLNLYHQRPHAFDPEDLRVLQEVAVQAGRAIQNAVEYDRTLESALTDSLTGLYNARHLNHFLDRCLERARNEERVLTVLVLDLDNFKPVNDRFGHARGNEVLRDLGRIFQSVLRTGDLVARYAGDEFVIVLPETGPSEARHVIEKIRAAVRGYDPCPRDADHRSLLEMGVSIGASSFPEDAEDSPGLINVADRAMFRDKRARKGLPALEEAVSAGIVLRLAA
jgi:diguanylate cyclase (GGDEF)-like protein/putative nucleotidyltransferase with HDIG domain